MRSLNSSDTNSCPFEISRCDGWLNCPWADPALPNASIRLPDGDSSTILFHAVSDTQMLPAGSTAIPSGPCSPPNVLIGTPVGAFSSTTRLLPVSATYTTLFATATSFGNEKAVDSHVVVPSVGDQRETRLLKVSATIRSGPADAMPKGQCSW